MSDIYQEVVHLSRLALAGRESDVQTFLRRFAKKLRTESPQAATEIEKLLSSSPTRNSPLRRFTPDIAVPVDADSRLDLVRTENPVHVQANPIWAPEVAKRLDQIVVEHLRAESLAAEGLHPTKSLLLVGPPGVGKSLSARSMAEKLNRPLLTLDLSSVMSSYLGKTGVNLRFVLEYAKTIDCVLFLDEFDAIAKRRDDDSDVGELKRLVTVLLQEIDAWPSTGLLVAATNHPELLDPAAWRRFEMVIEMPMPTVDQIAQMVDSLLANKGVPPEGIKIVASACAGMSYSDVDREIRRIHREAVIAGQPLKEIIVSTFTEVIVALPLKIRKDIARAMILSGISDRRIHELTALNRRTIAVLRKNMAT